MPTIHIPDKIYAEYVMAYGGDSEAKQAMKEQVVAGIE
jgi:hypothetical protein